LGGKRDGELLCNNNRERGEGENSKKKTPAGKKHKKVHAQIVEEEKRGETFVGKSGVRRLKKKEPFLKKLPNALVNYLCTDITS